MPDQLLEDLHDLVIDLLMQSMDPDHSPDDQINLHRAAKLLRQKLVQLRKQAFDAGTKGYAEAGAALTAVNENLRQAVLRINDMVKFMQDLSTLLASVDKLIGAAAG